MIKNFQQLLAMSTREFFFSNARLTAAPLAPAQKLAAQPPLGLQNLGLSTGRKDGVLYVPSSYRHSSPTPLILTLHGAGGNGLSELKVQWLAWATRTGLACREARCKVETFAFYLLLLSLCPSMQTG